MADFISDYLHFCRGTEVPTFYRRWCAIAGIGALLERRIWLPFGADKIYANIFVMLMGESGARKSTAIKQWTQVMSEVGYTNFAPKKNSEEGFIIKLSEISGSGITADDILSHNLGFNGTDVMADANIFVPADEFNNWIGEGNINFASFLGDMFDFTGTHEYKLKNSKPIFFKNPTITILGGNTLSNLMRCFKPHMLEQGFFSRMIFVYSEKRTDKIYKPYIPTIQERSHLHNHLLTLMANCTGEYEIDPEADKLLEKIYTTQKDIDDIRFKSYSNRRYIHLLKLSLIHAVSSGSRTINIDAVLRANTVLTYTEMFMPKALGEFGASKHSSVVNKVIQYIDEASGVVTFTDIWKQVHQDLDKRSELSEILQNLIAADKIQMFESIGFLPNKRPIEEIAHGLVDYSYLSEEERRKKL
jgi:hypothetical protein